MKNLVVLISGRGSNLKAILEANLPVRIACVISNRPDVAGLDIARAYGVPTAIVDHTSYSTRDAFDGALITEIDRHQPDLVVLAGFMRIFTANFVDHYSGRMINIHPSLLPAFPGLNTHERALAEGVRIHGCTVHFVTSQLDHGPIIIQAAVPVLPGDTERSLAARVLEQEHRIYPQAIRWIVSGQASIHDNRVVIDREAGDTQSLVSPSPDS